MIQNLLVDGRARVLETLQRGYAPSHFSHNLELIFVKDSRSSASASMKTKIASTRERSARIRTLDPRTLIWWATAFPMRHWSGGRKISSSTFDGLIRYAPRCAAQAASLLPAVAADLDRLRQKHAKCTMLQIFLGALSQEGRYVNFSGARYESLQRLPDLLLCGMESSRKYQEEKQKTAPLSTALKIFVPTNPNQDDAYLLLPVGVGQVWSILHELGVVE
ncbi:hypothetical protein CI102_9990 [Trichoderma harzianum]|uniref:Uncharacterized protein n=1 Tax=Trichoderma harzianum CBS 226.95 TaxID=983964 RepID=A0A2T4AAF1_TRIHA|nr:hypothetical protein M431DRAFT_555471 [Trichoderma harzianum CBS 226.95]PKK45963.1 hypothetical protein CI102_9990 [Trichoderma harzianum]PTB54051.1 hypothetical protein M431DRAFT_555471 [Trichoderma harzianum CBS 226.95]